MILVIYNHRSDSTRKIPIYNYGDIERLAEEFPVITKLEKQTSNPMELLQLLVNYLSTSHLDAHIENDGYKLKTKEQHRADRLRDQLKNRAAPLPRLVKSDKISEQGIVSQVMPWSGKLGLTQSPDKPTPYGRRFVFSQTADTTPSKMTDDALKENVTSKEVGNGHWYHVGTQGNHSYHYLSSNSDPQQKHIAGIITAKHEGKNYIRAAYSDSANDEHIDKLRQQINANPESAYEAPMALDSAKHMESVWQNHHPDLIHGLIPDKTLQAPPSTISSWISFAGVDGDSTPRVVAKESLKHFDRDQTDKSRDKSHILNESKKLSFFDDPNFTTAHREATYSKLAHEIFGLGQYVPKTTTFVHPLSKRAWSAMEFVRGATNVTADSREKDLKQITDNGDIYKLAIMNMIMGNSDRHLNNIIRDPSGNIHLIDHGLTFDYNDISTGLIPQYIDDKHGKYSLLDETVPEHVHRWLWNLDMTAMANEMHRLGAPHDIIMNTAQRLSDARGWSNLLKYGRGDHKVMHTGLRHLADMLRSRKFSIPAAEQENIAQRIRGNILNNVQQTLAIVGDRNIPTVRQDRRKDDQLDIATKMDVGDTIKNSATIAPDQAHVHADGAGEASIHHPAGEVSLRHDTDKMTVGKKRID